MKSKQKSCKGMNVLKEDEVFPRDKDTLCIIREIEACLDLENKCIHKMRYTELIKYIDQITLMLLMK